MRSRRAPLTVVLLLLGCCACSPGPAAGPAPGRAASSTSSTSPTHPGTGPTTGPSHPVGTSGAGVVGGRHAHLVTAQVTRTGDTLRVRAVWEHHGHATLASSSDGFTTTTYVDGQVRRLLPGARWPGTQPSASTRREAGLEDLAAARVPSLQPGTAALLGILDGAGASPLRAAARSVDGGATWRHVDVTGQRQARGYVTGGLVLQDGRLLVLEGHDTDRRARPADLRVSAGDDWTRYGAWRARFVPGLRGASVASLSGSRDPDPVVWATTTGQSLYVSSDGARTFRRVAARPHRPGRGRPPR